MMPDRPRQEVEMSPSEKVHPNWKSIYRVGAVAALSAVLVGLIESGLMFLPGGNAPQMIVLDWFELLQENPFMGLRNLGLLNILLNTLGILTYFALYAAQRDSDYQPYAALAAIISFLGVGIFLANNRAFPMLALSAQYAAAATGAQRAMLEAAGQAMLSVGASHTPGTFLGFILSEVAGITISVVMLRSKIFSRANAYAGILGFSILLLIEYFSTFTGLSDVMKILFMAGGLLSMVWYILIASRLFQLGRSASEG
jgi:hypothetical protein